MPAAHPYSVGVGCCLFDRVDGGVVEPAKAGGPCGPRPCSDIHQAENIVVILSSTETA